MLTGRIKGLLLCCEPGDFPGNLTDPNESTDSLLFPTIIYNVIIIILTGGILGNITILVVLSRPIFRGISCLYLGGIALAHLGVLVSWIPLYVRLTNQASNTYPAVFYSAHLELVAVNTCSVASILIMGCLMIDRYVFVFFPARIRAVKARKHARSFVLCSFILGFSASAPLSGMRMVQEKRSDESMTFSMCENDSITGSAWWIAYIWTAEVLTRICPAIVLITLNSLITKRFLELNVKKKQFQSVSEKFRSPNATEATLHQRNRGYREEQQLTVLTTCMILYFVITTIPSLIALTLYHYHSDYYSLFRGLSIVSELSNFGVHILSYVLCSELFRKELTKLIRGKCLEDTDLGPEEEVGDFEDFSRHGTTIRLTPEQTNLNSPGSPRKLIPMEEVNRESEIVVEIA